MYCPGCGEIVRFPNKRKAMCFVLRRERDGLWEYADGERKWTTSRKRAYRFPDRSWALMV